MFGFAHRKHADMCFSGKRGGVEKGYNIGISFFSSKSGFLIF